MLLTNSLLHALLVADDQSYNRSATPDEALAPFTDGDTVNLMPGGWHDDLTGWAVARRFDDPDTGFGAVVYKKPNGDGSKFDYIVALQGTRGPNAQDWHGNLTYGWEKFVGAGGVRLMNYLTGTGDDDIRDKTVNIHFTGQSLGGALAQYVAYRYVDERKRLGSAINPDNMSLTTFNGLGGMQALEQNYKNTFHSGDAGYVFNKDLLAGVATRHYWITNDIVSRLVPNLNGAGNEYRLDFHQNAIGSGPAQAIADAHRIESGFYRGFSKFGVDFDSAVQLGITHLDIGDVAKIGTAWANIFNNARTGDGEATARLISALMLGVAYGPVGQVEALTNAALEHLHADGTLDDAAYAFAREHTTELIRGIAQSPAGIATQARAWLLANILNLTETTDTSSLADSASYAQAVAFTDGAFATYSTELENPDRQALGDLDTILRKALGLETSTLSLKAVVAAAVILGPTAFEAAATPVPTLQSIVANSGVQAQMLEALKNTPDAVGAFLKSLAQGAIAAGQDVGKAIAEAASWLYEEAIQTAKGAGTAAVDLVSEVTDAVEDIFRSAGNAAGDFINKYSDAAVAWAAGLNDTLRKQLIDGFSDVWRGEGGQFGGAGATGSWDEFADGMAYAVNLGETADQKGHPAPRQRPQPLRRGRRAGRRECRRPRLDQREGHRHLHDLFAV